MSNKDNSYRDIIKSLFTKLFGDIKGLGSKMKRKSKKANVSKRMSKAFKAFMEKDEPKPSDKVILLPASKYEVKD